ncbi:MAG: hypothetical protein HQM12_11105 [SAR324 cluster bacterium]|nr:hypothetical protein [SAR324 cluster bacterium]
MRKKANVAEINLHDFRRYYNTKLLENGFSNEETGALIGNSAIVNRKHYVPTKEERFLKSALEKRKTIERIFPMASEVSRQPLKVEQILEEEMV